MRTPTVQHDTMHEGTQMRLWLASTAKGEAMLLLPKELTSDECHDLHEWVLQIFAQMADRPPR